MTKLFDLNGRTALVTGSARGIGYALAEGLAAAGARVIVNGTKSDTVDAAVSRLRTQGFDARGRAFDVTDEASVAAAFAAWDAEGIDVDIVVNNAGIQFRKPMIDLALADWQRVIDTNLTSAFSHAGGKHTIESDRYEHHRHKAECFEQD